MSTLKQHEKSDATAVADKEQIENVESAGEATMLVSEFPPPPYYYKQAISWKPPPIPNVALARGSRRAAAAAARARAADERQRLAASGDHQDDKTDAILGGEKDDKHDEEEGDVVAVLGEIVEDPFFVEPLDHCEDPVVVCNEMRRLNRYVLQGFVHLVRDLVDRPLENKKTRDELSHNIFLMLQECNKFREHQARELMIELLEQQLAERKKLTEKLRENILQADELLKLRE